MTTKAIFENGQLVMTRVYAASREDVFEAWVETSKVQQWWGCGDTTQVKSTVEPEVGGKYHHVMTIKNAGDHPIDGVITEFEPPALLAYQVTGETPDQTMTVRVEFEVVESGTQVRLTHSNIPTELGEIVTGGWTAAFQKLNRFLLQDAA